MSQVHPETFHLTALGDFAGTLKPEGRRIFDMDDQTMGDEILPDAALDVPDQAQDRARRALAALT